MSEYAWVSLIALLAWLVLALSAFRSHRMGGRKTVTMILAWAALFALVALVFAAVGG